MSDYDTFWREFLALDNLITRFTSNLPTIIRISSSSPDARDVLVASTLARVAAIQLHTPFVRSQTRSRDACLAYAQAVVATVQNIGGNVEFLDPIMAVSQTLLRSYTAFHDVWALHAV